MRITSTECQIQMWHIRRREFKVNPIWKELHKGYAEWVIAWTNMENACREEKDEEEMEEEKELENTG